MKRLDHYAFLGIPWGSEPAAIRNAYRALATRLHPDRHGGVADATRRFQSLNTAWAVLKDPKRRAAYDASIGLSVPRFEPGSTLQEAVGGVVDRFAGVAPVEAVAGEDQRYRLSVSFVGAALGTSATLALPAMALCTDCDGRGAAAGVEWHVCDRCDGQGALVTRPGLRARATACADCRGKGSIPHSICALCVGEGVVGTTRALTINIPPGIEDGAQLLVRGAGANGRHGGASGDLRVTVVVTPDAVLRREGDDILVTQPISAIGALLGGPLRVPGLGRVHTVKMRPGTENGAVLRLSGHGVLRADGTRGDELVCLRVEMPVALPDGARALLERAMAAYGEDAFPETARFDGALDGGGKV